MTVTAPETVARQKLKSIIETEFLAEGYKVHDDHLHESLGTKGTVIGTSPVRSRPNSRVESALGIEIFVQFYNKWDKRISPEQRVDPAPIETAAERFRRALRTGDPDQDNVWYFRLTEINYPSDPTGNKTRFEATVVALGNNSALIETVG